MLLSINGPIQATDDFVFPKDRMSWAPVSYENDYRRCPSGGFTPIRERARYHTIKNAVIPRDRSQWANRFGIYIIFMSKPSPTIYVGIASEDSKTPEGILSRFQKHRVKMSGSHVGTLLGNGGVHHPKKWGEYAIERHISLAGSPDGFSDLRIATATLQGEECQRKADLECFEKYLINNQSGLLEGIAEVAWPGFVGIPRMLNHVTPIKRELPNSRVLLWNGKEINLNGPAS